MGRSEDWRQVHAAVTASLRGFHRIPPAEREELVQEALERTLRADGVLDPSSFACRVARNLAISWMRRRRFEPACPRTLDRVPCPRSAGEAEARIELGRTLAVVDRAPPAYRSMLLALLEGEPLRRLIETEVGAPESLADRRVWTLRRDALYQRRRRSIRWLRRAA